MGPAARAGEGAEPARKNRPSIPAGNWQRGGGQPAELQKFSKDGRLAYCGLMSDLLRDPATGAARPLEEALRPLYDGR